MSPDDRPETKLTFDAPGDVTTADLASLDGVAGMAEPVTQDVDAEYFDTADLALLAAGIRLRRHRGGDTGWHVDIPRAKGERVELREPLDSSPEEPPRSLRDLVTARTRQAPLQRVARVRTLRTLHRLLDDAGASLAEVADDTVTADVPGQPATTWRALEVRLTGGDGKLLSAVERALRAQGAVPATTGSTLCRLLAHRLPGRPITAGAESATAGDVVRRYLREQRDALLTEDPAARVDLEDAVHKMRVTTRRLRSALATYRRLLDTAVSEPLRAELKWLGEVLGAVRDAEVIRAHFHDVLEAEPPDLIVGPVRDRIDRTLDARHDHAHRQLLEELTSRRYCDLLAALDRLPHAVGGERADRPAKQVTVEIRRAHRRMRHHLDEALATRGAGGDDLFHEVRKAAKRVRYAADSAGDVLGSRAEKLAARMEQAQEILGVHQDTVVIRSVLCTLAADAAADGEPTFTYGRLHAAEQQRGEQAHATFQQLLHDGWAKRPGWMR